MSNMVRQFRISNKFLNGQSRKICTALMFISVILLHAPDILIVAVVGNCLSAFFYFLSSFIENAEENADHLMSSNTIPIIGALLLQVLLYQTLPGLSIIS